MKFWPGKTSNKDKPELPIGQRIRAAHFRFGFGMGITAALGMTALLTSLELGEPVTSGMVAAPAIAGLIVGGPLMWSARRENRRLAAQAAEDKGEQVRELLRKYRARAVEDTACGD